MIQVTLQFASPEAAIAALAKLGDIKPVEAPARRGRADKGQQRGPNARTKDKDGGAGGTPAGQQQAPGAPALAASVATEATPPTTPSGAASAGATTEPSKAGEAATSSSTTAQPSGGVASQEAAQTAMEKIYDAKGMDTARDVLARFGAKRVRDLKPEQRAEFIAKVDAVIAGAPV